MVGTQCELANPYHRPFDVAVESNQGNFTGVIDIGTNIEQFVKVG